MKRIILHESVERDDIDDAMQRHGWRLANVAAASATQPAQIIFVTRDRGTMLHFVEDAHLEAMYAAVRGGDVDAAERDLRSALPAYTEDEIAALTARSDEPAAFIRGLRYRALTAPEAPSDELVRIFHEALAHPETRVRSAAAALRGYVPWLRA